MTALRAVILAFLAGCGRIAFDPFGVDAAVDSIPRVACTMAGCPAGYSVSDGGCYKLVTSGSPWLDAELACEADGAHLVVEDSVAEHFTIHTLASAAVSTVWVGWTDRRGPDNVFTWVAPAAGGLDPQAEPCVFGSSEPDAGDADHCVQQAAANGCPDYQDVSCELVTLPYVCECDGQLADPSTY